MAKKKQALLVIHGIGEQRPMDTLRGFVETVWTKDERVQHEHATFGTFSKPDEVSGSFELRRLTTTSNRRGVRTDFYEFYWAHLMQGTRFAHVAKWIKSLLLRWPWNVPRPLRAIWFLVIVLLAVAVALLLATVIPQSDKIVDVPKWVTGPLGLLVMSLIVPVINRVVGDAARYLMPSPANIDSRQAIRKKGVEIIYKLHDSGQYDRIINRWSQSWKRHWVRCFDSRLASLRAQVRFQGRESGS